MSLSNIIVKHAIKDQKGILFKYVDSYKLCKVATMWVRCPMPRFAQRRSLLLCGSHLYFCRLLKIYLSKSFGLYASNWHHSIKRPIRTSLFSCLFRALFGEVKSALSRMPQLPHAELNPPHPSPEPEVNASKSAICQILDSDLLTSWQSRFKKMHLSLLGEIYFFAIFVFFLVDFHSARLFFSHYSLFWPPEMIVNIIGDVYRSILIFTVLGIFHFWAFLAIFGQF